VIFDYTGPAGSDKACKIMEQVKFRKDEEKNCAGKMAFLKMEKENQGTKS